MNRINTGNVHEARAPRLRCYFRIFAEEAQRDYYQHFLSTIHLQRIWLDIIVCKLTTSYVQHWSKVRNLKIFQYTFHATLQHLLSEETLLVNYVLDTANLN